MTSPELENLAKIGKLKLEKPTPDEIRGLLSSAAERLADAGRRDLSFASRFDLAWRILAMAHERRNVAEYEGHLERDERLLKEVIAVAEELRKAL